MGKTEEKARVVIHKLIKEGKPLNEVKSMYPGDQEWFAISNKAYLIRLEEEKKRNKENETKPHVSSTPNATITEIIVINEKLSDYGLGTPISATTPEFELLKNLTAALPSSENSIIEAIARFNMHPKWRAMQKQRRFRHYMAFKEFDKIIDAALLCYYRENYVSCFLTLAPVIEGVLLRWMNYDGISEKPEFEDYRKFFKHGPMRQPCPDNILFHQVYSKVCDGILNKTIYKPTPRGAAHGDFNRHLALHLLKSSNFGTRANCVRLFILLDYMTEIFCYEEKIDNPFSFHSSQLNGDIDIYGNLLVDQQLLQSAEKQLLF